MLPLLGLFQVILCGFRHALSFQELSLSRKQVTKINKINYQLNLKQCTPISTETALHWKVIHCYLHFSFRVPLQGKRNGSPLELIMTMTTITTIAKVGLFAGVLSCNYFEILTLDVLCRTFVKTWQE